MCEDRKLFFVSSMFVERCAQDRDPIFFGKFLSFNIFEEKNKNNVNIVKLYLIHRRAAFNELIKMNKKMNKNNGYKEREKQSVYEVFFSLFIFNFVSP